MIDRQKLDESFQYFDKEVVIEIIDIFISEFDDRFAKIRQNILDGDFQQLKFNAHSLKGVIANFMDPVTIELSRKLDEKAKDNDARGLLEFFGDFENKSILLRDELKKIKQELTT